MTTHFNFRSAYRGEIDYDVTDESGTYRASIRTRVEPYETYCYNGTRDEYERDVAGALGLLHKDACFEPIARSTVAAFNAWRLAEHESFKAQILSQPERYGITSAADPFFEPPMMARGAHYQLGKGWLTD